MLWACLATMAAYAKELNTAEAAYAAIDEVISGKSVFKIIFLRWNYTNERLLQSSRQ